MSDMDYLTHKVEITITGDYPSGSKQRATVAIAGDGGIEHMLEAFRAALVAAGFSLETAKKIGEIDL